MGRLKIGVMVNSFKLGVKGGIRKAAELGVDGFQIYISGGEMAPWNLSQTGRRDFMNFVEQQGLVVSALCAELGNGGFVNPEGMDERIDKTKQMLDMSQDLGVPIVTTHIGTIPGDENDPNRKMMHEALSEVAEHTAKVDALFAIETGPEEPELLREFLLSLPGDVMRVNYDPANLLMRGFDEVKGVSVLNELIVHTHAKDGVRLPEGGHREMALGKGGVRWNEYIAALDKIGYDGFYTIEREVGDDPVKDISDAVEFLKTF